MRDSAWSVAGNLPPVRTGQLPILVLIAAVLGGCATPSADQGASLCPDVPAGIAVDADGCPLYSDGDAVADYQDQCPDTAPGIAVDAKGCPLDGDRHTDDDTDGVTNSVDACSDTPVGSRVGSRGCPLAGERIAIITNINFDFDRVTVREDVRKRLSRVIALLKEMSGIHVQIVGYTDDVGSTEYNLTLSFRRAESVRDYMVKHGIESMRLTVAGRGKTEPLVSNSTPQGRAVNRRVEFVVQ
jgi:OOP family OmpA-OmpF porin